MKFTIVIQLVVYVLLIFIVSCSDEETTYHTLENIQDYENFARETRNEEDETNVGILYYTGTAGAKKDYSKALYWFNKAANKKYPEAMLYLGIMYELGAGVKKDYKKAIEYYKSAADKGNKRASANLGMLFAMGENNIPVNLTNSKYYFNKAWDINNIEKFKTVISFLEQKKQYKGIHFLCKAFKDEYSGYPLYVLAQTYSHGFGCKKNQKKAFIFFKEAANKGNASAMVNLAHFYRNGNVAEKNQKKAIFWFKKSASMGNAKGLVGEAWCNDDIGNFKKAKELFEQAIASEPNNGYFIHAYGYFLFKNKQYSAALKQYDKAIKIRPNSPVVYKSIGDTFNKIGNYQKAEQYWKKSLKYANNNNLKKLIMEKLEKLKKEKAKPSTSTPRK